LIHLQLLLCLTGSHCSPIFSALAQLNAGTGGNTRLTVMFSRPTRELPAQGRMLSLRAEQG